MLTPKSPWFCCPKALCLAGMSAGCPQVIVYACICWAVGYMSSELTLDNFSKSTFFIPLRKKHIKKLKWSKKIKLAGKFHYLFVCTHRKGAEEQID